MTPQSKRYFAAHNGRTTKYEPWRSGRYTNEFNTYPKFKQPSSFSGRKPYKSYGHGSTPARTYTYNF